MTAERLRTNRPDRQADSQSANNQPLSKFLERPGTTERRQTSRSGSQAGSQPPRPYPRHPCAADCKTRLDIENPNSDMLPNASSCSNQFPIKSLTKSAARSVSSHHQNASTCCWLSAPPPPMPQPLGDTWNHPQRYITSPGNPQVRRNCASS